jgi:hypothetical protein
MDSWYSFSLLWVSRSTISAMDSIRFMRPGFGAGFGIVVVTGFVAAFEGCILGRFEFTR